LVDRATNILERILLEPRLKSGEITLIGHSLGGLIIKQLLRDANTKTRQRKEFSDFIDRVRRIVFLATPHSGSDQASLGDKFRFFIRPSAATTCLVRNAPNLRELNNWYRLWVTHQGIAHLILTETRSIRIAGMVVKPDSSDPGLPSLSIPIDADHVTICKPSGRDSEIYRHVRHFLEREEEALTSGKFQAEQLKTEVDDEHFKAVLLGKEHPPKFIGNDTINVSSMKGAANIADKLSIEKQEINIVRANIIPLSWFIVGLILVVCVMAFLSGNITNYGNNSPIVKDNSGQVTIINASSNPEQ